MIKTLTLCVALVMTATFMNAQDKPTSLHSFTVKTLEGEPKSLADYKGKALLVVNVASKCGATKQYTGLEALYKELKDRGFVILGFPSNEFGGQEPGTAQEIRQFCSTSYQVSFPLFEKIKTNGAEAAPIYKFLTQNHPAPSWNFHKYLIDKNGTVVGSFTKDTKPEDPELRKAIEAVLAK